MDAICTYAARYNENSEIISTLIKAGADVNARNKYQSTPLHYAVRYNENSEIINALVAVDAKIDSYALEFAKKNDNKKIRKLLKQLYKQQKKKK